jgi:hypothetical protein
MLEDVAGLDVDGVDLHAEKLGFDRVAIGRSS